MEEHNITRINKRVIVIIVIVYIQKQKNIKGELQNK